MIKKIFFIIFFLSFYFLPVLAKENLDMTLQKVADDVSVRVSDKTIVCVLDFDSKSKNMGEYIRDSLISVFSENPNIRIVTRQNMDKVEKELDYQYSGYVSDETALSLCQRLGAQEIVFGQIDELNNVYILQVKMLNVETGAYSLFKKYEVSHSAKTEQLMHHSSATYKSSLGFIVEANKNSVLLLSPAGGIAFDYSVTRCFSVGVKAIVSYDFLEKNNTIYAVEPLGFLRWYVVSPSGEPSSGLFVEGQGGAELLFVNSDFKTAGSTGLTLGFRIPTENFYCEPFLRCGYPYMFGAGISACFRF